MGKYIWPRDIAKATSWYLGLFKRLSNGASLDEILAFMASDLPPGNHSTNRRDVQRTIYRLERRGFVKKTGSYNQANFAITKFGLSQLKQLSFMNRADIQPEYWDGRWRVVLFDIPEKVRPARFQIRRLLKELGFYQLQKSAWVHKLPLLEAFQAIQDAYGIKEHIQLLEIVDYHPSPTIKAHFDKLYPNLHDR